jgi:hypothetical protein
LPTQEEFISLKQCYLTQGDTPWNSSLFSHQVADKLYKQVIDTDFNSANTLTLFPYDPADMHKQSLLGKPAKLIFIPNVMKTQVNHIVPMNADPHNRSDLGDHDDKSRRLKEDYFYIDTSSYLLRHLIGQFVLIPNGFTYLVH